MASNRWVAIDPAILTHPLVGAGQPVSPADPERGAYSRMEAWVWIICNASFADHTVLNRGRKMTLQRGDLLGAWAFLAHTFNWSAKVVRAWVEKLIEDNMLQRRALEQQIANGAAGAGEADAFYGNQASILNIVNYWRYQFGEEPENEPKSVAPWLYNKGNQKGNQLGGHLGGHLGNQSDELTVSKIADKYILQQQQGEPVGEPQGQPIGQPKGQHIIKDTIFTVGVTNYPLSEPSSDEGVPKEPAPKEPKAKSKRKRAANYSEAFEVFWSAYPDRTNNSKPEAFKEWDRLEEPDQNAALASMPSFASYCRKNPTYRCVHAERYLRDRRWESHLPSPGGGRNPWWKDPKQIADITADRWVVGINRYANGTWPVEKLGPPPGHPECKVPEDIIVKLNLADRFDHNGIARRRP